MTQLSANTVVEMFNNNKSTYEIADALKTYPNKVRRLLKKLGIAPRNHSEAQSAALTSGRTTHPTKGTVRSEATKKAICEKI